MEKRKNTPEVVDGNGAAVQKEESKFTKFMRIKRNLSICFNFVYIIAYMAFTVFTFAGDNAEITWLPYVFGGFIVVYAALFIASLALAKNDRRKANAVKDYKSGFKIVKKLLKMVNLVLAIALVVNAVSGDRNIFSLILSCISVLYVAYQIIAEIRKMIKRRKQLAIKEKKDECDKKFIDDVKKIWNGCTRRSRLKRSDKFREKECTQYPFFAYVKIERRERGIFMPYSIMLDAGHGGKDPGAVSAGRQEKDDTLSTAEKAKKISARAKEYYGERKKIDEEMSGKKKKKDDKK